MTMFISSRRRAARALTVVAAMLTAAGACANPFTAPASFALPRGTKLTQLSPFSPTSMYGQWWKEAEQCAGRTGDQNAAAWFLVNSVESFNVSGVQTGGMYDADNNRVYLAQFRSGSDKVIRTLSFRVLMGSNAPIVPTSCAELIFAGAIA